MPISIVEGGNTLPLEPQFSGTLVKRVNGKTYRAQVFAKGDRLRVEYKYAIRTELGFATIQIIRPDLAEVWYLLPQQKQLLVVPLTGDVFTTHPELIGETSRTAIGDTMVAGRNARVFHVQADRNGQIERFYESVDEETGVVLKLVSQDRDWSFEYERLRVSPQPSVYFDEPPGYRRHPSTPAKGERARG
ncbi:MAG: hypothetical protein H8K04_08690 [Nitrospira sp.]